MKDKKEILVKTKKVALIIFFGIFGRLLPHVPNVTPMTGLTLFAGTSLPRRYAVISILLTLFISDLCLSMIFGYPILGWYTVFTYTGFLVSALAASKIRVNGPMLPFFVVVLSLSFWLWTNFGVWLTGGLYPMSLTGLLNCYYMALPFLRNAIIGDLVWCYCIFGISYFVLRGRTTKAAQAI